MELKDYVIQLRDPKDFERYKCSLCKKLIHDPIQTYRGESACQECYNLAKRDDGLCPIDGEPIEIKEFRDRAKERDIKELECLCVYDCPWEGKVGELKDHLERCEFKPVTCELCFQNINQSDLQIHLQECPNLLKTGKCIYEGCNYQVENIETLRNHLQHEVILHAYLHTSIIKSIRDESRKHFEILQNLVKDVEVVKRNSEMKILKDEVSALTETIGEHKKANDTTSDVLEAKLDQLKADVSLIKNRNLKQEVLSRSCPSLQKLYFSTSPEDKNFLSPESISCPASPLIIELSTEIDVLNRNVNDLELRQQLHENTSYDGKLVWKIDNIARRRQQAIDGEVTALHSAPTFSDRNGYKFCSRLYLDGDGAGKGSHISLFIILMKSEYDELLEWPFREKVSFRLINQYDRRKDITESFTPDPYSASFRKPKREMNIASGCPLFVPRDKFLNAGFLKENCIYIEVKVGG